MAAKNVQRSFWIGMALVALLGSWAVGEGVAALVLRANPGFRIRLPISSVSDFSSQYELKESLSQLPLLRSGPPLLHTISDPAEWRPVVEGDAGVWAPPAKAKYEAQFVSANTGKILRTVEETTDAQRRRVPPWQGARLSTARRHLMVLGCSLTWGEGVKDSEALPAQLSKGSDELVVHNAGYGGYGPAELLVRMKHGTLLNDLGPQEGAAVFYLHEHHFMRFFHSAQVAGTWRAHGLVVEERASGFEAVGSIQQADPLWVFFSKLWIKDPLATIFHLDLPPITDARLDEFFRAVKEMEKIYRARTRPDNPFVVVLGTFVGASEPWRRALDRAKIFFLDYSKVDMGSRVAGSSTLPDNPHPSPEYYEKVALALKKDLKDALWNPDFRSIAAANSK